MLRTVPASERDVLRVVANLKRANRADITYIPHLFSEF